MDWYKDVNGQSSFTRVMGAVIIVWNLVLLTISVIANDGKLPTLMEASACVTMIGSVLTGKAIQRFGEKPDNRTKEDK